MLRICPKYKCIFKKYAKVYMLTVVFEMDYGGSSNRTNVQCTMAPLTYQKVSKCAYFLKSSEDLFGSFSDTFEYAYIGTIHVHFCIHILYPVGPW